MKQIGLFEAKTTLSALADRVKRTGEPVTLTKHNQPVVDLVPHQAVPGKRRSRKQVLTDLNDLCRELPKSTAAQIKADIEQGRR